MDWKLLIIVIIKWVLGSAVAMFGGFLFIMAACAFHDWAKPIDTYVILGSVLMWVLLYGIYDSYSKAMRKKKQKTAAELQKQMFSKIQKANGRMLEKGRGWK